MKCATLLIATMLLVVGGCANELKPASGMAALRVKVAALPKQGIESSQVAVYDSGTSSVGSGAFERVDYSDLGDIVVWVERDGETATPVGSYMANVIDLDAAHPKPGLMAAVPVGAPNLVFRNAGTQPVSAYSVSDGNTFNLGTIASGQQVSWKAQSAGLIEILTDASAEPIARIFAAKGFEVRLTRSGATIDINNVSPGIYHVHSWHPRLPGSTLDVQLAPDQARTVTIGVTVNGLPKIDGK